MRIIEQSERTYERLFVVVEGYDYDEGTLIQWAQLTTDGVSLE